MEKKVIDYFLTNKNNSVKEIAKHFKTTVYKVNYILDKMLKEKGKSIGVEK